MDASGIGTYSGLRRELEVGLCIAPTHGTAIASAKAVAAFLDEDHHCAVRLAGLSSDDSRVLITLAVTLGTIDEIKAADATSRAAMDLVQRLVDSMAACDPYLVSIPHPASPEARLASRLVAKQARENETVVSIVGALVAAA
jgi:hypothetical protein